MKITKDTLKQLIKEELETVLEENDNLLLERMVQFDEMLDFKGVYAFVQRYVTPRTRKPVYKVTGDYHFMMGGKITIEIPGSMPKLPPEGAE
jgi:hypothetical protein|tara:strand:+ start:53 stop:328 length:276 start_codon:yes stop_codon:yes gene_type:complete